MAFRTSRHIGLVRKAVNNCLPNGIRPTSILAHNSRQQLLDVNQLKTCMAHDAIFRLFETLFAQEQQRFNATVSSDRTTSPIRLALPPCDTFHLEVPAAWSRTQ
jgi:hypothetical protein